MASPQAPSGLMEVAPSALPPEVVANGRQGHVVRSDDGDGHPLPLPGQQHPLAVAERDERDRRVTHGHGLVESRMHGNAHVRFGGAGRGDGCFERSEPRPGPTPNSSGSIGRSSGAATSWASSPTRRGCCAWPDRSCSRSMTSGRSPSGATSRRARWRSSTRTTTMEPRRRRWERTPKSCSPADEQSHRR